MGKTVKMKTKIGQCGSVMLWMIGAFVVISALTAGVALMSPSAMQGKLAQEAGMRAYYNANSGLNYILSMQAAAKAQNQEFSNFINAMGNGENVSVTISGNDIFSFALGNIVENESGGTYQINTLIGAVKDSSGELAYQYSMYGKGKGRSGVKEYIIASDITGSETTSIYSTKQITLNSKDSITGNVYTDGDVTINSDVTIVGNVYTSGGVTVNGGKITGNLCSYQYGKYGSWSNIIIKGDVYIYGDQTISSGTYEGGTIWCTGSLYIDGGTISDDIKARYVKIQGNGSITGTVYSETTVDGRHNIKYAERQTIDFPTTCPITKYLIPTFARINGSGDSITKTYTFSASKNNGTVTINGKDVNVEIINSIQLDSNTVLQFDLSGGDINIFVNGNVTFNSGSPIIKISTNGLFDDDSCVIFNPKNITEDIKKYAKRIYLESSGTITLNNGSSFVGSLLGNYLVLNSTSNVVGGVYTKNNSLSPSGFTLTYVESNWINNHWLSNE